jgi:hypothetical protein
VRFGDIACYLWLPFLVFEILCALTMVRDFWEGIFFGFVLLFRALARLLGFSTGIVHLWRK